MCVCVYACVLYKNSSKSGYTYDIILRRKVFFYLFSVRHKSDYTCRIILRRKIIFYLLFSVRVCVYVCVCLSVCVCVCVCVCLCIVKKNAIVSAILPLIVTLTFDFSEKLLTTIDVVGQIKASVRLVRWVMALWSLNRAWNSLRKWGFSWKQKSKIAEKNVFCEGKKSTGILFFYEY